MALKKTPLNKTHIEMGAKMVPFAGWEMPVYYSSIMEEHNAVRNDAGLFDICHMGKIKLEGSGALSTIQKLTTNDASKLEANQAQYSIVCNSSGGTMDDILVYRFSDHYIIIANAINFDKILAWFIKEKASDCKIEPLLDLSMLSLQGPNSLLIMGKIYDIQLGSLGRNRCTKAKDALISRTGYTGEDGFELFLNSSFAEKAWKKILGAGAKPCGLGARDTLRLEAALPLYGHEYNEETSPLEAGYSWAVKFDKTGFTGKAPLSSQKEKGLKKVLSGIVLEENGVPREGFEIFEDEGLKKSVGKVTSGTFSPTLKKGICLFYSKPEHAVVGKKLFINIRGKGYKGSVIKLPFYKRAK